MPNPTAKQSVACQLLTLAPTCVHGEMGEHPCGAVATTLALFFDPGSPAQPWAVWPMCADHAAELVAFVDAVELPQPDPDPVPDPVTAVRGELQELVDEGADLAVTPDWAARLWCVEQAGGIVDLVTGAVHWPATAAEVQA